MNQEDKDLLELAAKAAGLSASYVPGVGMVYVDRSTGNAIEWNPLTSDGDCERMEAELGICLMWSLMGIDAYHEDVRYFTEMFDDHGDDKQAARRLASLRVAAAIGRTL